MLNISKIIGKFVKNSSQRELDKLRFLVEKINQFEPKIKELSNEDFPNKTKEFKSQIQKGKKLEDLIFAYKVAKHVKSNAIVLAKK